MTTKTTTRTAAAADKAAALRNVQELNFAMIELALYLNTHPCDEDALALYGKVQMMHAGAKIEFEDMYGPLSYEGVDTEKDGWSWVKGPWPWEGEC